MIQFDVVLLDIGGIGLAQIIFTLLLSYFNIPAGFNAVFTVFGAYTPDYRCNVPPLDNASAYPCLSEADILNLTTPYDRNEEDYNSCYRYGFDLEECTGSVSCVNQSYPAIKCDNGYYYDRTLFDETVVTEFNLICDQRFWEPLSSSLYYCGMLIGSFFGGLFADAFGRKRSCLIGFVGALGCTFGMAFARSFALYLTLRVVLGGINQAIVLIAYVYIMEIVSHEWRTFLAIGSGCFYALGYMILSGVAYYWNDWHEMMVVCGILAAPFLIIILFLPESPRWLFAKGKETEGFKVSETMARINKRTISEETRTKARKAGEEFIPNNGSERKYSSIDLFRSKRMRWITINVGFNWFVNSFVYYGITLNAGALAGDIFINNVLSGVFDILAHFFSMALINRVGRRLLLTSTLLLAGVSLLGCVVVNEFAGINESLITFGVVLAFIGKFGISSSFSVIYALTTELYPTVVRSNGVGLGSTTARIGGIIAPFLISLGDYAPWLPNTIFGLFGVIAGILSLAFPETNGRPLTETIEEAEDFYRNAKYITFKNEKEEDNSSKDVSQLTRF